MISDIGEILEVLDDIMNDSTVPKNVKTKITEIVEALNESSDLSIRVNKALHLLDEISDDTNLQAYTRTQIWNVVSVLEKIA